MQRWHKGLDSVGHRGSKEPAVPFVACGRRQNKKEMRAFRDCRGFGVRSLFIGTACNHKSKKCAVASGGAFTHTHSKSGLQPCLSQE